MTEHPPHDGSWVLPPGTERKALDAALRELFPGTSWGKARALITTGKVKVGDETVHVPTRFVRAGDSISIKLTAPRPSTTQRVGREIIAYLDPHVVARFTWPFQLASGQVVEASLQGYTGKYVVAGAPIRPLGMGDSTIPEGTGGNKGYLDQRIAAIVA